MWRYKIEQFNPTADAAILQKHFDEWGQDGWELVCSSKAEWGSFFIFKKPASK